MKRSSQLLAFVVLLLPQQALSSAVCGDNLSCNSSGAAFTVSNSGSGSAIYGYGTTHSGIYGYSTNRNGVEGVNYANYTSGVYGESGACNGYGVAARSTVTSGSCSGAGVYIDGTNGSATFALSQVGSDAVSRFQGILVNHLVLLR